MKMTDGGLMNSAGRLSVVLSFVAFLIIFAASSLCWAGDAPLGEKLYKKKCAICHGDQGQGGMAKKLNDPESLKEKKDEDIRGVITNGNKGMPAYKSMLKPEEIEALVAVIRSWAK